MIVRLCIRIFAVASGLLLVYWFVVWPARCNQAMRTAGLNTRTVTENFVTVRAISTTRENIRLLESVPCCDSFERHLLLALNKRQLGRFEEAIVDLTHALQTAQRPEIYFNRGLLYLETGRVADAIPDLVLATEFAPHLLYHLDYEVRARVEAARSERRTK